MCDEQKLCIFYQKTIRYGTYVKLKHGTKDELPAPPNYSKMAGFSPPQNHIFFFRGRYINIFSSFGDTFTIKRCTKQLLPQ